MYLRILRGALLFALPVLVLGQNGAKTAMEESIAKQRAAIDAFKESAGNSSLSQQRESVRRQSAGVYGTAVIAPLEMGSAPAGTVTAVDPVAPASVPPVYVQEQRADSFFTDAWPRTEPLSMPNVQMAANCDAIPAEEIEKLTQSASTKHNVDAALLKAVIKQESAFKPCALSVAGARGLMQIMPATADFLGLADAFDPAQNVDAGARFLRMMLDRYRGDVKLALSAYNAGPGRVDQTGEVPSIAETVDYVNKVLGGLPVY